MHPNAAAWDKREGVDTSFATGKPWPEGKPIPQGRPCDVCGKVVERGFVHTGCRDAERDKFLDLL